MAHNLQHYVTNYLLSIAITLHWRVSIQVGIS